MHKSRKLNVVADALSYGPGLERGEKVDVTALPSNLFAHICICRLGFEDEDEIVDLCRRYHAKRDAFVTKGLDSGDEDFVEIDGVVKYKGLV